MRSIKYLIICVISVFIAGNIFAQEQGINSQTIEKQEKKEVDLAELPKWLKKNPECQDTIAALNDRVENLQKCIDNFKQEVTSLNWKLQAEQEKSKIDNFLNITDTTIFGTNFQKVDVKKCHPQRCDWYLLIENIHDLKNLLTINSASNDAFEVLEMLKHNNTLEKAQQKIIEINSFDCFDFLTEPQKQYYRQLVTRYNMLNKYANP
ncbi:hypothetical protein AGMMS49574_07930 [Bacteroidia bacterium]|nr:hypothetical protein AGMMS49574_07930 [Bacteroidia bacterium]